MRRVKIAELRDQLSRYLRYVQQGAEIEVTDRDRPIARIVPLSDAAITVLLPKAEFSALRDQEFQSAGWGVSSTDLLLEERQRR